MAKEAFRRLGKDFEDMLKVVQFRRTTAILTLIAASLGGGLIAAFAVSSHSGTPLYVRASAAGPTANLPGSFADVISRAAPAVVSISSTRIIKASEQTQNNPFMADPFFRQFFGGNGRQLQPRDRREGSLGSGVIINADGYILTNNHVVEKATEVKVSLLDKREFRAKVVGTDPQTDLAVVKIDAKDLPSLMLGDSAKAQIGDLAFAIGNPFGVGQTVTMGIVSAKGRTLPRESQAFEDFIQTDAAINPGNSGGALINARGELIGINTAILTGSNSMSGEGGNIGIGFAIPVNMAEHVMEQLVKNGKVTRGYMGAYLQGLTADVASSFGLKDANGALVDSVEVGKPADKAGIKQGDVITAINGQPVDSANALTNRVVDLAPGTAITLDGYRDGHPIQFHVTLGTRPGADEESAQNGGNGRESSSGALQGVQVENLTGDIRQELQLPSGTSGVVVTGVDESSAAAESGLQRGDVIQQVNRQAVTNQSDFDRLVRQAGNKGVLLTVNRQGRTFFTAIESK
jgi:serine protease Do